MKNYQKNLLIPLLMAIVMMAMSPTKMWAQVLADPTSGSGSTALQVGENTVNLVSPYLGCKFTAPATKWYKFEVENQSSVSFYVFLDPEDYSNKVADGSSSCTLCATKDMVYYVNVCNSAAVQGATLKITETSAPNYTNLSLGDNTISSIPTSSGVTGMFKAPNSAKYSFTSNYSGATIATYSFDFNDSPESHPQPVRGGTGSIECTLQKDVLYFIDVHNYTSNDFTNLALNISEAGNVASVTIGGSTQNYESLSDAFKDAMDYGSSSSPATVKLLSNVSLENRGADAYTLTHGVMTLDLNGKTVQTTQGGSVLVVNGANLTIEDNSASKQGSVIANGNYGVWYTDGKLLVNGGIFQGRYYALYGGALASLSDGDLTLHGGTFLKPNYGETSIYIDMCQWDKLGMSGYYFADINSGDIVSTNSNIPVVYGDVTVKKVCTHTHRTHVPAVAATATADGNIEYWKCDECGKLFDAATGGNQIQPVDVVAHNFENGVCTNCHALAPATQAADGVYEISTARDLAWFRDYVNATTAHKSASARLTADIDLSDYCHKADAANSVAELSWEPIANDTYKYENCWEGSFDGQGHTISKLYINGPDKDNMALFGFSSGTIQNLKLQDVDVTAYEYVAALCAGSRGTISNIEVTGSVSSINNECAGIVYDGYIVKNCVNRADVSTDGADVAGICTYINYMLDGCSNYGTITSYDNQSVAGIVYEASAGATISNCANYGKVESKASASSSDCPAGIVASAWKCIVSNCANFGDIYSVNAEGGASYIIGSGQVFYIDGMLVNTGKIYNNASTPATVQNGAMYPTGLSFNVYSSSHQAGNFATTSYPDATELASGETAFLLQANSGKTRNVWGQMLTGANKDSYPVIGGAAVYAKLQNCDGSEASGNTEYTNNASEVSRTAHTDTDSDGFCDVCHHLIWEAAPELVTAENYATLGLTADYIGYKAISNLAQLAGFAAELNAPMTKAEEVIPVSYTALSVGENTVNAPVVPIGPSYDPSAYAHYTFTPTLPVSYKFELSGAYLVIFNTDPVTDDSGYLGGDEGSLTYSCSANTTYHLMICSTTGSDLTGVTLTITALGGQLGGGDQAPRRNVANQQTASAPRKAAQSTASSDAFKYVLTADITVNSNLFNQDGTVKDHDTNGDFRTDLLEWNSPSFYEDGTTVIFDGNNHTISGLYKNTPSKTSNGNNLYGFVTEINTTSKVLNLGITESYFDLHKKSYVGSIAGYSEGEISNCWSDATLNANSDFSGYNGGIVGRVSGGSVRGCHFSGDVIINSSSYFSGIASEIATYYYNVAISDCHFSGTVEYLNTSGSITVSGIAAYIRSGNGSVAIDKCYADATIFNDNEIYISGLVDDIYLGAKPVTITNCYNAMSVTNTNSNATYEVNGLIWRVSKDNNYQSNTANGISLCFSYGDYSTADDYYPLVEEINSSVEFGVQNCFYLDSSHGTNKLTAAEFASGSLAYDFNKKNAASTPVWYQKIGTDLYPTLKAGQYSIVYSDDNGVTCYNEGEPKATYEIVDAQPYTYNGFCSVGTLTYKRTFADNDFNCLYVPFDAPVSDFTDCSIYAINMFQQHDTNNDGVVDDVTLEVIKAPADATIKANHPYLIKYDGSSTGTELTFTFSNVTLASAATPEYKCSSMNADYVFQGMYTDDAPSASEYYTLVYDSSKGKVVLGTSNNGVGAQRWYMTMVARDSQFGSTSSNGGAKSIDIVIEGDEVDGIDEVSSFKSQVSGKFIENGKVVIIRNGKKYNLNGQVIK